MFIEGIWYELINILFVLMSIAGPTQVAGTNGTTAAMLKTNHSVERVR